MDSKEIEERLKSEVYWCQITYQLIDECIFPVDKKHCLEPAQTVFNRLYTILVDYLCMRIGRLFDRAQTAGNENFSFEWMKKHINAVQTEFCAKEDSAVDSIKSYRNKYLAHSDLKTVDSQLANHKKFLVDAGIALQILHRNLAIVRYHNGNESDYARKIEVLPHRDFINLVCCGAFMNERLNDKNNLGLTHEYVKWLNSESCKN
ncbi:MAG: hypothetical protein CMM94_05085 [Rickettsiales bacterium]|nr:hypothetical protein [Rickettsiales bacterium]